MPSSFPSHARQSDCSLLQFSGYGKSGFARRVRIFELSQYGERIETFKLLDTLERIDRTVLVGEDAMGL